MTVKLERAASMLINRGRQVCQENISSSPNRENGNGALNSEITNIHLHAVNTLFNPEKVWIFCTD